VLTLENELLPVKGESNEANIYAPFSKPAAYATSNMWANIK
jgi:hypothetical protein